jgi:hypothetical protein
MNNERIYGLNSEFTKSFDGRKCSDCKPNETESFILEFEDAFKAKFHRYSVSIKKDWMLTFKLGNIEDSSDLLSMKSIRSRFDLTPFGAGYFDFFVCAFIY